MDKITLGGHPPYNKFYKKKCEQCGIEFFSKHPQAKYFPNKCRQNAYRDRLEQKVEKTFKLTPLLNRKKSHGDSKYYWSLFQIVSKLELNYGFRKILGVSSIMLNENLKNIGDEILIQNNNTKITLIEGEKYKIEIKKWIYLLK
jgi:hypothetical protein